MRVQAVDPGKLYTHKNVYFDLNVDGAFLFHL